MPNYKIINKKEVPQGISIEVLLCTDDGKCEQQIHIVETDEDVDKVLSRAAWAWQDSQLVVEKEKEVFEVKEALSKDKIVDVRIIK